MISDALKEETVHKFMNVFQNLHPCFIKNRELWVIRVKSRLKLCYT